MCIKSKHNLVPILLLSCMSWLAAGCENFEDSVSEGGLSKSVNLTFNAELMQTFVAETRGGGRSVIENGPFTPLNGFANGIQHAFGMSVTKKNTPTVDLSETLGSSNLKATYTAPSTWAFQTNNSSSVSINEIKVPTERELQITAYHPVVETGTEAERKKVFTEGIPFNFSGGDDGKTMSPKGDILYATNDMTLSTESAQSNVNLNFKHACSQIIIRVWQKYASTTSNTSDLNYLKGISIENMGASWIKNKGHIDPKTGFCMPDALAGAIMAKSISGTAGDQLKEPFDGGAEGDNAVSYTFQVPSFMDKNVQSNEIVLNLDINGSIESFPLSRKYLNSENNADGTISYGFRQGYQNIYNLEYDNSEMKLIVLNWREVAIDGSFGDPDVIDGDYCKIPFKNDQLLENVDKFPLLPMENITSQFVCSNLLATFNLYDSYQTTVELGNNGEYLTTVDPKTYPVPIQVWFTVKSKIDEGGGIIFYDVVDQPVSWQDASGRLIAKEFCKNYRGGGNKTDWRLPTASELKVIMLFAGGRATASKIMGLTDKENRFYWSGTEYDSNSAWAFSYQGKTVYSEHLDKRQKAYIRCVRTDKSIAQ